MITRRNFIQALGMVTVAGATFTLSGTAFGQKITPTDFFPIPPEAASDPVLSFTSDSFIPFVNTDFEIRQESLRRPEIIRLLEVKDLERKPNRAEGLKGASFSLLFFSPRNAKLKTGQFEFNHFSLGTFRLTLSPIGAEPNVYEVVINHVGR
jgi:hypothetical protein